MKNILSIILLVFIFTNCYGIEKQAINIIGDYNDEYEMMFSYDNKKRISSITINQISDTSYIYFNQPFGVYSTHLDSENKINFSYAKDNLIEISFIDNNNNIYKSIQINDTSRDGIVSEEVVEILYNFELETTILIGSLSYFVDEKLFIFDYKFQAIGRAGKYFDYVGSSQQKYLQIAYNENEKKIDLYTWKIEGNPILSISNINQIDDTNLLFRIPPEMKN